MISNATGPQYIRLFHSKGVQIHICVHYVCRTSRRTNMFYALRFRIHIVYAQYVSYRHLNMLKRKIIEMWNVQLNTAVASSRIALWKEYLSLSSLCNFVGMRLLRGNLLILFAVGFARDAISRFLDHFQTKTSFIVTYTYADGLLAYQTKLLPNDIFFLNFMNISFNFISFNLLIIKLIEAIQGLLSKNKDLFIFNKVSQAGLSNIKIIKLHICQEKIT